MKKLILILIVFISIALNAQIPKALNIRIADSELKGLLGVECQVSKISISGSWRPGSTPFGRYLHSFNTAFTLYGKQQYEHCNYISIGIASEGSIYQKTEYSEYTDEPSLNLIIGRRFDLSDDFPNFSFDLGFGYNMGKHYQRFSFEVVINYTLFKNK